jgi:hypothetical protein
MNKKGSLSLSITAIVVIVIAFVVLGLGLSLTRTIFKGAEDRLSPAFDIADLEKKPTSDNPLTIKKTVEIGRGKTLRMGIGFYNVKPTTLNDVILQVSTCKASSDEATGAISPDTTPQLTTIAQNVGPSEAVGFEVIFEERELLGGFDYICTLEALAEGATEPSESKQFFLHVTS